MERTAFLKKQRSVMRKTNNFLLVKLIFTLIITVLDFLLVIFRTPLVTMGIFGMVFTALIFVICMTEMTEGFLSVFKRNPSNDSFASLALIFVFLRSVSLLFLKGANTEIFSPVLFFSIAISLFVKRSFGLGISRNLAAIKDADTKIIGTVEDHNKKIYVTSSESREFPDIVASSYASDPSESRAKIFVPVVFLLILFLSLVVMWFRGFSMFFTSAAVFSIIAASFSSGVAFVLPYNTMQSRLRKHGMIFFGYTSISDLKDVSAVVVKDKEIFPPKKTEVKKITIKTAKTAIAMRYIDRILKEIDSPSKAVFDNLDLLESEIPLSVESVRYVRDQGAVAVINEDKVLFGTRNLLLANGVEPYSREKESSIIEDDSFILYLAVNGELSAALLFEYGCSEKLKKAIPSGSELDFLIKTRDAAVSKTTIEKEFGIKKTKIFITDEEEYLFFENYENVLGTGNAKVSMIMTEGIEKLAENVILAKDLDIVFKYSVLSKHIGIIVGLILSFGALIISPSALSLTWLFIYNAVWLIPSVILSSYRRKK